MSSALSPLRKQLEHKTTEELRQELLAMLSMTAQNLLRLALVVSVLESRGENLSNLKNSFLEILRAVAAGKLLPEAVVKFSGEPYAIRRLLAMTIIEQKRITEAGAFPKPPPKIKTTKYDVAPELGDVDGPGWIKNGQQANQGAYFKNIAKKADPKDVGEMAADLVLQSTNPKAALAEFTRVVKESGLRP